MFLIDTSVISEARKGRAANGGVSAFLREADRNGKALYLSLITIGELQRGVRLIRHRGDPDQAGRLERWLMQLTQEYRLLAIYEGRKVSESTNDIGSASRSGSV